MLSRRALVLVALVAGMLNACDRAKVEETGPEQNVGARPETKTPPPLGQAYQPSQIPKLDKFAPQAPPVVPLGAAPPNWEKALAQKASLRNPTDRARAIFSMIPSLPPEALDTAARKAVDQLPDADYASTALPVMLNPTTHGQVLSVLFADLLDRSNTVTLPALLNVASSPTHPFAPAALDDLRLLLDADYGTNWAQWDQAIRAKLAAGK